MTDQTPNGTGSPDGGATPPPPPPAGTPLQPPVPPPPSSPSKWYENIAIVVIALFCCWPLGLAFVWMNKKWTTKTKGIITGVIIAILLLGGIATAVASGGSSSSSESSATPATKQSTSNSAGSSDTTAKGSATTTKPAAACKDTADDVSLNTKKQDLYPQRLGISKDDHEALVGDCTRIDGMTAYVTSARVFTPRYGEKVIVVSVTIRGRDGTKSYNPFDFKLQNASGSQESITFIIDDSINELNSGSLVKGGEVKGDLVFKYSGPGTYYIVWEPGLLNSDKGIWAIDIP